MQTPNDLYDGPSVEPQDIVSVYVVLNGALNMSPGKIAAQSFHCGWYLGQAIVTNRGVLYEKWMEQGRRVVVRIAKTQHVFDRAMEETTGFAQMDEGLTEVPRGTITAFVTIPYVRSDVPKILSHNKLPLA